MLAQGSRRPRPSRYASRRLPASLTHGLHSWRTKRSAGAVLQTEKGEKPRSRLTRKQTKFRLLARLTHCGRNADYRVMRISECPEGRLLTVTSEPCGHRLAGDEAGFKALLRA